MAITLTVEPDTISAAYRPVLYTATSNTTTNARMIADVKIDGTIRASIDKDPNIGTSDTFDFDIQSVVQDFLTQNLQSISSTTIVSGTNSEVSVVVDFYQVLDTTASGLTTNWLEDGTGSADATASTIHCINATLQHEETQDLDIYTVDSVNKVFLTNSPKTLVIGENETAQLAFVLLNIPGNFQLELTERDSDGSETVTKTTHSITDKRGEVLIDVASMLGSTVSFDIQLLATNDQERSETVTYNINTQCYDNPIRIKWLNPLGGIDAYTFTAKTKREVRFRSKKFDKVLQKGFSVSDSGETVLSNTSWDHYEIFSKSEPRATIFWLVELGGNNINAWVDDGTNLIPIIITSVKTKILDTEDGEQIMSLKYKLANQRQSQRN